MNRSGLVALAATLLAAALHPDLPGSGRSSTAVVAGLTALWLLAVVERGIAGERRLFALGAMVLAGSVAFDVLRGVSGELEIAPGAPAANFREEGPGGRDLGLRPLGLPLALEGVAPDASSVVLVSQDDARYTVSRDEAVRAGAYRLGRPVSFATGGARRLRVTVTRPSAASTIDVVPGGAARAEDLEVRLEQYFPDFALDERQQPFSRSDEPNNPAALLQVSRGSQAWRVFVLRAMPGLHRPEGLDATFTLADVEAASGVRLRVSREPAAAVAAAGLALAAIGLVPWRRRSARHVGVAVPAEAPIAEAPLPAAAVRGAWLLPALVAFVLLPVLAMPERDLHGSTAFAAIALVIVMRTIERDARAALGSGADPSWLIAGAGIALSFLLAIADGGRVLRWSFGLGSGETRLAVPIASYAFGAALLLAWAAAMLATAHLGARGRLEGGPRTVARALLVAGVAAAVVGLGAALRAGLGASAALDASAPALAGIALGAAVAGVGAIAAGRRAMGESQPAVPAPAALGEGLSRALAIAAALLALATLAEAFDAWWTTGSYLAPASVRFAALALVGVAAATNTSLARTRLTLFAGALAGLLFLA